MLKIKDLKNQLVLLREIQAVDKRIYDLRQELAGYPAKIKELEESFQNEKAMLQEAENHLKQQQLALKTKDLELKEKEERIRKLDGQLMQVKTNKEYAALQGEIRGLKADCSLVEDAIIQLLDDVKNAEQRVGDARRHLKEKEDLLNQQKKIVAEQTQQKEAEIESLTAQRNQKIETVDHGLKSLYERMLPRKQGLALAPVVGENCGACQILLRAQTIDDVRLGERVTVCESCSRILYCG